MITLKMNVNGVTRSLQLLADSLKPSALKKPLFEISKAKQAEVRQRFEQGGPGWAARSAASLAQESRRVGQAQAQAQERTGAEINRRLANQLSSAKKRMALSLAKSGKSSVKATTITSREFERAVLSQLRGKQLSESEVGLIGSVKRAKLLQVQSKLFKRALGIQDTKVGNLLGRLANSIKAKIENSNLVILSEVMWSGMQNDGGNVGNGATLPARTFLEWTEDDMKTSVEAFERHMIKAAFE